MHLIMIKISFSNYCKKLKEQEKLVYSKYSIRFIYTSHILTNNDLNDKTLFTFFCLRYFY